MVVRLWMEDQLQICMYDGNCLIYNGNVYDPPAGLYQEQCKMHLYSTLENFVTYLPEFILEITAWIYICQSGGILIQ